TPPNPPPDGDPLRGAWACQTCTFLNTGPTVLCAVCERPRLAGRPCAPDPQHPPDGPPVPMQAKGAPGWQCEHCTFWNQLPGRVCEVCNRTSQLGGPPQEEKGPRRPGKPHPLSPEEVERRRQEKLREDGMKLVAMIREAELVGVAPEEVGAALRYSGTELPLPWLRSELPAVLDAVVEQATERGAGAELGAITQQEARAAWTQSQGDLDEAVSRCLSTRRSKVRAGPGDRDCGGRGLVYLQENGIACPKCKFPYALARGGCMHFQCSQCRHHFCSGCYGAFYTKNKCPVPSCPVRQSLHGHHPRDCLFYLRDWDVGRLQRLLQVGGRGGILGMGPEGHWGDR
ncbi:E3 ubiquitin-protein ligase RNF31-like, partial [Chelonoidis abingdonii]|uniref:E3 ubiquitin-protein ligase RNF31-like n=1 Tax=Chelonoidis abingdonii TaxID=106734 RepID=UPI003F493AE6